MDNLLQVKNLSVEYSTSGNQNNKMRAVNDISFYINKGEIYALAGESGCGKTTVAKVLTKLIKPFSGDVLFNGKSIHNQTKEEQRIYPQKVQMVFQNPYSSLNPKMKIGEILKEPLDINTKYSKSEKKDIIIKTISDVGLQESSLKLYPHEFSGGQRQRIAIARAIILNPEFLIADEPVSALDASIQAQIINLFRDLKKQRNLTILFISHDLNVIRYLADRVGIMYMGKLVEENDTFSVFNYPKAEYTKILLNSAPKLITSES